MILEYLSMYSDRMDVILFNITFRKIQMDINNTMINTKTSKSKNISANDL